MLVILVIMLVAWWKVFTKAGEPGWAALIPIYNMIVLMRVIDRPWWWILGYAIPILNWIVVIVVSIDLAKSFGKSVWFGLGIFILPMIFYLILAFGSAEHVGREAAV
jgi:hypothetical protein